MTKRAPLTAAQREKIAELRGEKGWSMARIAQHLGVSEGSVSYRCLIDGVEKPGQPPRSPNQGPMIVRRGSFDVRRFSAEEDADLCALEAAGLSASEIGRRLHRRANSIKGRLATLARRDERSLAQADALR
jgi:DNA-binding NarL/FixJ family response regulator